MPNSHGTPDSLFELQAVSGDLLPACVISQTFPSVPVPPGMTLAAFATSAYIREGPALVYTRQDAQPLTLTGADGTYWAAISTDTWTDFAQWTRQPGTHYLWRPNSTQPADVDGLLVAMQLTVAGGAITAVTPIASRATLAAAWRGLLALGTMATQNAGAVAITGGTILNTPIDGGTLGTINAVPFLSVNTGIVSNQRVRVGYNKNDTFALIIRVLAGDTGPGCAIGFHNAADTRVGFIDTNATSTTYNTSSDARLKTAIEPLTGAGAVVRRLTPVQHRWRVDGSRGYGFLAHEVQQVIPDGGVVTGEHDALDADGNIVPQMLDPSKLVPWLTAALQEALDAIEHLTGRLQTLEAQGQA